jgi:hypothetical protein
MGVVPDDFTVLRPDVVWCFWRLRIERARRIRLEFTFIPTVRRHRNKVCRIKPRPCAIRRGANAASPSRRVQFDSLNVHTGFCRVAIYDCGLNCRGANGRRELNFIRKFDDGLGALTVGRGGTGHRISRENEKYLP